MNVLYDIGLSAVCGGELDMETGQLESPNYPEDYHPNKECVWRVTVPKGFQVALKFQSFEVCRTFIESKELSTNVDIPPLVIKPRISNYF